MRILSSIGLVVVFLSLSNCAVSQEYDLDLAVLPLAQEDREQATIVYVDEEGAFQVLRSGSNKLFCIADEPGDDRFSLECHPNSLMTYLERKEKRSLSEYRDELDQGIDEDIQSGALDFPVGARSYFISGRMNSGDKVPDSARVWQEIAVPFASEEQTGLPTEDAGASPWLMGEDSHGAHIMIGYRTVAWERLFD
ncbi:MAG: hypothetical protein KTR29_15485 [Rhodothermaceae bacterium]|nr:hypothetical protein [Rhodothermaceae bacterium]